MSPIRLVQVSLFVVALVAGCKKAAPPAPASHAMAAHPNARSASSADADVRQVMENFRRVTFEHDSSALTSESKRVLDENAAILQRRTELKVEVQGHCDERGTVDYNLALGNRRAVAVRDYLVRSGVSGSRTTVVSFGEERPLAADSTPSAWAANRRAEFRVLGGGEVTVGTTR